jgi:hypothetical protein
VSLAYYMVKKTYHKKKKNGDIFNNKNPTTKPCFERKEKQGYTRLL